MEEEGFSKSQAVVMDFLTREDLETGQHLYEGHMLLGQADSYQTFFISNIYRKRPASPEVC